MMPLLSKFLANIYTPVPHAAPLYPRGRDHCRQTRKHDRQTQTRAVRGRPRIRCRPNADDDTAAADIVDDDLLDHAEVSGFDAASAVVHAAMRWRMAKRRWANENWRAQRTRRTTTRGGDRKRSA